MASEPKEVRSGVGSRIYNDGNEARHTDTHLKAFCSFHCEVMHINVSE